MENVMEVAPKIENKIPYDPAVCMQNNWKQDF